MRIKRVNAFIVHSFALGEADLLVTAFTDSGDLIKFVAKGSRKIKSRFAAYVQLFNLGSYGIYHGKGLPILNHADIIKSFSGIRKSWEKTGCAYGVAELCRLLIGEEAGEKSAFNLVMDYLNYLDNSTFNPLIYDSFRLKLVVTLGYGMSFSHCALCGSDSARGRISWEDGGIVCEECLVEGKTLGIRPDLQKILQILQSESYQAIERLSTSPAQRQASAKAVDELIIWLTEGKARVQTFRKLFEEG